MATTLPVTTSMTTAHPHSASCLPSRRSASGHPGSGGRGWFGHPVRARGTGKSSVAGIQYCRGSGASSAPACPDRRSRAARCPRCCSGRCRPMVRLASGLKGLSRQGFSVNMADHLAPSVVGGDSTVWRRSHSMRGDGHVAAGAGSVGVEQEVAPASCAALPEFPAAGFGQRGQGGEEVGFFLLSVDDRGIPMQVEPGHAGGQEMAFRREDAAPFRLDGAQLGQHGLAGLVLVELHQEMRTTMPTPKRAKKVKRSHARVAMCSVRFMEWGRCPEGEPGENRGRRGRHRPWPRRGGCVAVGTRIGRAGLVRGGAGCALLSGLL